MDDHRSAQAATIASGALSERTIALALIGIGAWLRLRSLSEMEFKGDEMRALQLGAQILADQPWLSGLWPTHGMPSSNNIGNAPLFSWLVAGAWALVPDPVAVARLIALANIACLYPLFCWCRRHMSATAALMVLAVLALNPFSVMFSRKIWGQDLLCVGVVLAIWAVEWLRSPRPWRGVVLMLLAIVFLGQMHQSGPIALAVLPVAFVCQAVVDRREDRQRRPWPPPSKVEIAALVAGIALVLFFWIPYLSYLSQVPLDRLAERPRLPGRRRSLQFFWRVADQVRPADIVLFFRPHADDFLADRMRRLAFDICMWTGTPLLIYGVWRWLRKPHALPVAGYWWIAIIAAFALALIPTYPFYVLVLLPLPALLAGGAFDGALPGAIAKALLAIRVIHVMALFALTISLQNWLFSRGGAPVGDEGAYGVPYSIQLEQAQRINERLSTNVGDTSAEAIPEALVCRDLPEELIWLAGHLDPSAPLRLATRPIHLCDGFVDTAGHTRYRWALR